MIKAWPPLVLCAVLLAGCGSDPQTEPQVIGPATSTPLPTAPATSSTSPGATRASASGAPSPTGAVTLDEATRREVLAVPVQYYEAIERAYQTLDPSEVERLSSPKCKGCQAQIAFLRKAEQQRYTISGGKHSVSREQVLQSTKPDRQSVRLQLTVSPATVTDSSGREVQSSDGVTDREQQVDLERSGGTWVVEDIIGFE